MNISLICCITPVKLSAGELFQEILRGGLRKLCSNELSPISVQYE